MTWRDISTAPKDGTFVLVRNSKLGGTLGPYEMAWDRDFVNPLVGSLPGLWVARGGLFTWSDRGGFGPTEWAPILPEPPQ